MERYWVVVVDDDALSLKNARALLQGEKLRISAVRSGRELLTFMKKNDPDLILMDVMMPVMDGLESAHLLRSLEREDAKKIPIIAMTANAFQEDVDRCLAAGMNTHIAKPIEPDLLLTTLRKYLKEASEN